MHSTLIKHRNLRYFLGAGSLPPFFWLGNFVAKIVTNKICMLSAVCGYFAVSRHLEFGRIVAKTETTTFFSGRITSRKKVKKCSKTQFLITWCLVKILQIPVLFTVLLWKLEVRKVKKNVTRCMSIPMSKKYLKKPMFSGTRKKTAQISVFWAMFVLLQKHCKYQRFFF